MKCCYGILSSVALFDSQHSPSYDRKFSKLISNPSERHAMDRWGKKWEMVGFRFFHRCVCMWTRFSVAVKGNRQPRTSSNIKFRQYIFAFICICYILFDISSFAFTIVRQWIFIHFWIAYGNLFVWHFCIFNCCVLAAIVIPHLLFPYLFLFVPPPKQKEWKKNFLVKKIRMIEIKPFKYLIKWDSPSLSVHFACFHLEWAKKRRRMLERGDGDKKLETSKYKNDGKIFLCHRNDNNIIWLTDINLLKRINNAKHSKWIHSMV